MVREQLLRLAKEFGGITEAKLHLWESELRGVPEEEIVRAVDWVLDNWEDKWIPRLATFKKLMESARPSEGPRFTWDVDGAWSGNIGVLSHEERAKIADYVLSWPLTERRRGFVSALDPEAFERLKEKHETLGD